MVCPSARVVCFLASLNQFAYYLGPDEVRDDRRHAGVEAHHVQHAAVVRVGEGEAVGGHAHNDCLGVADELIPILTQGLSRVDVARPRFAVRVGDEARHFSLLRRAQTIGSAQSVPPIGMARTCSITDPAACAARG